MNRRAFSLIAGGLVLLLSYNVQALPITLATDESALFNFDLTTEGSAPFTDVDITFTVTGPGVGELFSFDLYGDLFAVDYIATFSLLDIGSYSAPIPDDTWAADGLFSVRFTATPGPITITQLNATGYDAIGVAVEVDGVLVPVPEPSTLWLLGLGLVGIGYQRRKQFKAAQDVKPAPF